MTSTPSLYLGFDLSTQQLKAIAITSRLEVIHEALVEFDVDLPQYRVEKGVHVNASENEVNAPVAMWIDALELVLTRLKEKGIDYRQVKAISGAGQQHGSVYWSKDAGSMLQELDGSKSLREQLDPKAFSHPDSPNWQDASTQKECDEFDKCLGSEEELARITGSKAHHRFTGPQILRFRNKHPDAYRATSRISLVSSFLASLFLGRVAAIDIGDVCGMNLWDIQQGQWSDPLLELAAGEEGSKLLLQKLGEVRKDGGGSMGSISKWFVDRHGFNPECSVCPFTGDNPSSILSLPLKSEDAIVSLGTSTTFLMSTPRYVPDPAYHFMNHPTTPGLYMFMLCYKNGGLAREQVRDTINDMRKIGPHAYRWSLFDEEIFESAPMLRREPDSPLKMGLYFPLPEIVPNVRAGTWRYTYRPDTQRLARQDEAWSLPMEDARAIIESQIFSLRLRSQKLVTSPHPDVPPQPRRIFLTGGGAQNMIIARTIGEMLGGTEGVYQLDVGGSGCALGAAHKAVWATERKEGETFEDLIGSRWNESGAITKVNKGYERGLYKEYGKGLPGFATMEQEVVREEAELRQSENATSGELSSKDDPASTAVLEKLSLEGQGKE
ncbi:MAG: hypothetical protein M1817_002734 [Caeruleum heppii]|nr:MAG: hypothetical protein M1817_002734 [Caeruleum heppii]